MNKDIIAIKLKLLHLFCINALNYNGKFINCLFIYSLKNSLLKIAVHITVYLLETEHNFLVFFIEIAHMIN